MALCLLSANNGRLQGQFNFTEDLLRYRRTLNWMLLIADYRGILDLSEEQLKEWAILDTFDVLSPMYPNFAINKK